uniref:Uncharacterized protein n=1 Tax=Arundo donax TaxID=35708 RepID=A0A0A9AHA4_ARUDO
MAATATILSPRAAASSRHSSSSPPVAPQLSAETDAAICCRWVRR